MIYLCVSSYPVVTELEIFLNVYKRIHCYNLSRYEQAVCRRFFTTARLNKSNFIHQLSRVRVRNSIFNGVVAEVEEKNMTIRVKRRSFDLPCVIFNETERKRTRSEKSKRSKNRRKRILRGIKIPKKKEKN